MPAPFNIQLTSNAAAVLKQVQEFPVRMGEKIAVALDLENELTTGYIQANKLSRRGPDTLGVVTNRYRSSLRPSKAVVMGNTVESAIGTNVQGYPKAHEFGFNGIVTVRAHRARHHTLDVFAIKGGQRVQGYELAGTGAKRASLVAEGFVTVRAHSMKMNIPARAPIQTGLSERTDNYSQAISGAILAAWQEGGTA